MAAVVLGLGIALVLVGMRLHGIVSLGPWGVASTFVAVALGIAGVDLLALGSTFNYLVALFHRTPVPQGLFGRQLFRARLDREFWWMGGLVALLGLLFGLLSLALAIRGWPMERLWMYLLAGTMLVLVGMQLVLFWIIMRVLEELSTRQSPSDDDLSVAS